VRWPHRSYAITIFANCSASGARYAIEISENSFRAADSRFLETLTHAHDRVEMYSSALGFPHTSAPIRRSTGGAAMRDDTCAAIDCSMWPETRGDSALFPIKILRAD